MNDRTPLTDGGSRFDFGSVDRLLSSRDEAVREIREAADETAGTYRLRHDWTPDRSVFAPGPVGEAAYYAECFAAVEARIAELSGNAIASLDAIYHRDADLSRGILNSDWESDATDASENLRHIMRRLHELEALHEHYHSHVSKNGLTDEQVRQELGTEAAIDKIRGANDE